MRTRSLHSGTTNAAESEREKQGRLLSGQAAAEGMVLLENDGVLPLKEKKNIALFGNGARMTLKGGTGSGDVNERHSVSIEEGLTNASFTITTGRWIDEFDGIYEQARIDWKQEIADKVNSGMNPVMAFFGTRFLMPAGGAVTEEDIAAYDTDTAIYVISRLSGEGRDRTVTKGDYFLYDQEYENLKRVTAAYEKVILVINTGSIIDLGFLDEMQGINAVIYMMQSGMEGGNALASILTGTEVPSGKLTDSWPYAYEDYANASTFSHNNGNLEKEYYTDGIYVGYRYFDTFGVPVRYSFGYGQSYTQFEIAAKTANFMVNEVSDSVTNGLITVAATVKNTGETYAGKEVVQIYVSCPKGRLHKEYQRLAGFGKTDLLAPGEEETLRISFPIYNLASYDEESASYILEPGEYIIRVGNAAHNTTPISKIRLDKEARLSQVKNVCPLQEELAEIKPETELEAGEVFKRMQTVELSADILTCEKITYDTFEPEAESMEIAKALTVEELAHLVCGKPKGKEVSMLGTAAAAVPGGAGETTRILMEKYGLPNIVLADGPAGLRLNPCYYILPDGSMDPSNTGGVVSAALPQNGAPDTKSTAYYQYCTAIPIGTALAQTWNLPLIEEVGALVGREMDEFGVTLWLAPGMNIHRNPLCGRNFEYYSEEPLLTGCVGAAMTKGVQKICGTGTTIKHYACNNQEENRKGYDAIVSERALREIYLKGFEIAVRSARPMSIMTSYNLLNGTHTANLRDLCATVAREEWGFTGLIMSDWSTTQTGGSSAPGCISAGNDLIMPGTEADIQWVIEAVKGERDETLALEDLQKSAAYIISILKRSSFYGEESSYASEFVNLPWFVKSHPGKK